MGNRSGISRPRLVVLTCLMLAASGCGPVNNDGGGDQDDPVDSRDTAAFSRAVSSTCNRLGLAFSQTDVQFLLDELSLAIEGTGYTDSDAINSLRSTCPGKVNYANALP